MYAPACGEDEKVRRAGKHLEWGSSEEGHGWESDSSPLNP